MCDHVLQRMVHFCWAKLKIFVDLLNAGFWWFRYVYLKWFDKMSFGEFEEQGLNYIFLEHIAHVYYECNETWFN